MPTADFNADADVAIPDMLLQLMNAAFVFRLDIVHHHGHEQNSPAIPPVLSPPAPCCMLSMIGKPISQLESNKKCPFLHKY